MEKEMQVEAGPEPVSPPTPRSDAYPDNRKEPIETTDVEKDAGDEDLQRVASAPVYSIFSYRTKMFILASVSISSLISPFGATTFYPALNVLAKQLHVTPSLINISLTTYMIAQAIAPAIIAGMSDNSGRRLSFLICFVIFIAANVGLALQTNYAALLVLRMVQATGCSAAIALTAAVVADVATSAERGTYMGYATAGLLIGPSFGPTIGGLLAQYLGWRSIFWFLVVYTGVLLAVFVFFFPETCRNVVGNGSVPAKGVNLSILGYLQQRRHARETDSIAGDRASVGDGKGKKHNFPNPLRTLKILGEKESAMILLYNGLFFTGMMVVTTAIPHLYSQAYGLGVLDIGLCYISQGMGSLLATLTMGRACDANFRRHARRLGLAIVKGKQQDLTRFPVEVVRFQVVLVGHVVGTLAILAFGWTLDFRVHIAAPEIALFFIGFGTSTAFNLTNTLLIDLHRDRPATATAAVNFVRCLMSAGGAAAIVPMCDAMGPGWAFTLIAFVFVAWTSLIFVIMRYGQKWRMEMAEEKEKKKKKKKKKNREAEAAGAAQTEKEEDENEAGDAHSNADNQSAHDQEEDQPDTKREKDCPD